MVELEQQAIADYILIGQLLARLFRTNSSEHPCLALGTAKLKPGTHVATAPD
jgi:hypothetical protein